MEPQQRKAITSALGRYRFMAWLVGCLLVILVCVGMPLKYIWAPGLGSAITTYIGIAHGWLYMVLLITAYDIGRRVHWPWKRLILIALAGTVPFLSFVAEHYATKNVRQHLATKELEAAPSEAPTDAS